MIRCFLILFLLTVSIQPLFSHNFPRYNLMVISWDGVQREHLFELMALGRLPNLEQLAQKVVVNYTISDHGTNTRPSQVQMMTGYSSFVTGCLDNQLFQPIPDGLTIFERLKERYGDKIRNILVSGRKNFANTRILENCLDALDFHSPNNANASVTGPIMIDALKQYANQKFFAFFHFADPDTAGHIYGENSVQYEEAIERCDRWLGRLQNTLRSFGVLKWTKIIVTTDHGFEEGKFGHSYAPDCWLVTNMGEFPEIRYMREIGIYILRWYEILPWYNLAECALTPSYYPLNYYGHLIAYHGNVSGKQIITYVTLDDKINHDWGYGSPSEKVQVDDFFSRWFGYLRVEMDDTYTFFLKCDNTGSLHIDGDLVVKDWYGMGESGEIFLTEGWHHIKILHREKTKRAMIKLEWESSKISRTVVPPHNFAVEIFGEMYGEIG